MFYLSLYLFIPPFRGGEPLPLVLALYVIDPGLSIAISSLSSLPFLHSQADRPLQLPLLPQPYVQPLESLKVLHWSVPLVQAFVCQVWVSVEYHMLRESLPPVWA